jgi:hypothetical protein
MKTLLTALVLATFVTSSVLAAPTYSSPWSYCPAAQYDSSGNPLPQYCN